VIRTGGDLAVETLTALGVTTVFGIPGQHALGLFDALSRSTLRFVSSRVENNAAFAADGYSRVTGHVGVLFLSTGPGALTALAGLQEAWATGVPVLVVASQIPRAGLGGRRKGMLHQLDDQKAAAAQVTKSQRLVQHTAAIPAALQDAWAEAVSAPQGPVWVEIPQDVLLEPVAAPSLGDISAAPVHPAPLAGLVREAAERLSEARRPVIVAGGGARRGRGEQALLSLAGKLGAPVLCTPGGKGAFPWNHPLSLQSWVEDRYVTEVLEEADVLLVVGSSLGEVTSNYFTLDPRGLVIQVDAEARVLESNHPALGIRADAGLALEALDSALADAPDPAARRPAAEQLVSTTLASVQQRLDAQDLGLERRFMADLRAAVPDNVHTFWDMTIAAYWAWSCWDSREGGFHSAQGAGGLGFGLPGALGAAAGLAGAVPAGAVPAGAVPAGAPAGGGTFAGKSRVLAVSGDGSAMYSIAELATARQHNLPVTWLIVDDGGYGVLREYMEQSFGAATATELAGPDFAALAESFGVPAVCTAPEHVRQALADSMRAEGPNVVVVRTRLALFAPTHL
jgi:acetolactate synthase-1/2/3 large subunit